MQDTSRFVVQQHTRQGQIHWDLMLEVGDTLQTYRIKVPPDQISNQKLKAIKIFDHPLRFLTYQGTVNEGAGSVKIADKGIYTAREQTGDFRKLVFDGDILKGEFLLEHIEDDRWELSLSQ